MCLETLRDVKYIKKLPKEFTAYKVVEKINRNFYPIFYHSLIPFRKENLSPAKKRICDNYIKHFHCFKTLKGARNWRYWDNDVTIKVTIKRKDVSATGIQTRHLVIVTKRFTTDFEILKS